MISDKDREEFINYRINQALDTIREVNILINSNLLHVAVNRIYYGMFSH